MISGFQKTEIDLLETDALIHPILEYAATHLLFTFRDDVLNSDRSKEFRKDLRRVIIERSSNPLVSPEAISDDYTIRGNIIDRSIRHLISADFLRETDKQERRYEITDAGMEAFLSSNIIDANYCRRRAREKEREKTLLKGALKTLDQRELKIIQAVYPEEHEDRQTLKDLANKRNISIERISQIEERAFEKLKKAAKKFKRALKTLDSQELHIIQARYPEKPEDLRTLEDLTDELNITIERVSQIEKQPNRKTGKGKAQRSSEKVQRSIEKSQRSETSIAALKIRGF